MRFWQKNRKYVEGFSLVELVVVAALFITVVASFFGAAQIALRSVAKASENVQAAALLGEGVEGIRYMRDLSWTDYINLQPANGEQCFIFNTSTNIFVFSAMPCTQIDGKFKRTVQLWDVCRATVAGGGFAKDDINGVANPTCSSGTLDSSTKKIKIKVIWGSSDQSIESVDMYLANLFVN